MAEGPVGRRGRLQGPEGQKRADLGILTEQKGNMPLLDPSPGLGTMGQVRETLVILSAPN